MGWGRAVARGDGVVEADGYLYLVVLPDALGGPAATREGVDPDRAEKSALILAWPVRQGLSGRWTFGAHALGVPLATESAAYSGIGAPPPGDAFLAPRDRAGGPAGLTAPPPVAGEGRDGNAWRPLPEIIERLRQDEPDVTYAPPEGIAGIDAGYRARKMLRSSGGDVHGFALSVAAGRWVVEAAVTHIGKPEPGTELRVQRAVERTLALIRAR